MLTFWKFKRDYVFARIKKNCLEVFFTRNILSCTKNKEKLGIILIWRRWPFILRKITFLDPHLSFTRRICALCASANASVIGLLPSRSVSLLQELGWSVCVYHCAWRAFYFLYTSFTLEKEEKQQFCENNVFRDVFSLTHLLQGVFVCPIISCNTTYSPLHTHDQVCVC